MPKAIDCLKTGHANKYVDMSLKTHLRTILTLSKNNEISALVA